jgi:hypothetical protein
MWRILGLPWPSSRMIILNVDYNLLKTKKLKEQIIKNNKNFNKDVLKQLKYDKELGVEFPSSRFY